MKNCIRKLLYTLFVSLILLQSVIAQKRIQLKENSIVKDSLGNTIPYVLWSQLIPTGRFNVIPNVKENNSFIMIRLSDEEYEKILTTMPKPTESTYFKTGSDFKHFKATDIEGIKINSKDLVGKTLVLNFWFINCPPCQIEIPDLHKLSKTYQTDSSVIFIAVALDQEYKIKDFIKTRPFDYRQISDGSFITNAYGIIGYPTNVIVGPNGKVYFHSTGLGMNTVYWLKKSIEELKNKSEIKN